MTALCWLASYPKSGNTWFRVFLENLLTQPEQPCNINHLAASVHCCSRNLLEEEYDIPSSLLRPDEQENLRPRFYSYLAQNPNAPRFYKVHDCYQKTTSGQALFPPEATKAALYFIRNPLDVCVSYAHHKGCSFDPIIESMADPHYAICALADRPHWQFRQTLSSWSQHVENWTRVRDFPLLVLRYEDLKRDPFEHFSKAVTHLGLDFSAEAIQKAIDFSRFDRLQLQENRAGFKEKPHHSSRFFRSGQIGDGMKQLSEQQAARILADHRVVMARFGYLEE